MTTSPRLLQLQGMLDAQPQEAFLLFAVAKEHEKLDNAAEALAHYERLREADADYVGLYYHLGKLHERAERYDQAVAVYAAGMLVAKRAGDQHALAELAGAKLELSDDE